MEEIRDECVPTQPSIWEDHEMLIRDECVPTQPSIWEDHEMSIRDECVPTQPSIWEDHEMLSRDECVPTHPNDRSEPEIPSRDECIPTQPNVRSEPEIPSRDECVPTQPNVRSEPEIPGRPVRSCSGKMVGSITWPEQKNKHSKFTRLSVQTNIDASCHMLRNGWKLPQANLLLFFIDLEPSVFEDGVVRLSEDLHSLSEKINILVTTMGHCKSNSSLPQIVHKVKERIGSQPQGLFSIALPSWRDIDVETQDLLQAISKGKKTVEKTETLLLERNLGRAHDFYLMVDDDKSVPASGLSGIITFRQGLEDALRLKDDIELPAAYILAGGAEKSWDYMMSALKKKIPVIVLVNSGGLADKLFKLRENGNLVEGITVDDDGMPQQSLELENVSGDVRAEFDNYSDLDGLLKRFIYIQFYDVKDQLKNLEDALCEAFIQARQDEQLAGLLSESQDTVIRMQQQGRAMMLLLRALMNNCPESVRILLDQGLAFETDFKKHHLAKLYAKVKDSSLLYKLAKKAGKNMKEKNFTIADSRLVVHYLLQGCIYPLSCGSRQKPDDCKCSSKTLSAVQNALKSIELHEAVQEETVQEKADCCMEPSQELFLWAVLMGRGDLAELFWEMRPERTSSALIANALLKFMAKEEGDGDDHTKMSELAKRFEEAAKGTLDTSYKVDRCKTNKVLSEDSQCWGSTCGLDLAFALGNKEVVASTAFSAKLDSKWRGDIDDDIGVLRILLCLFCPCFIPQPIEMEDAMQKRNTEGNQEGKEAKEVEQQGKVESEKRSHVIKFYTSPRVKFILAQMSIIAFLFLYAFVILFQITPQQFTPAEMVLCLWVFTLSVQEGRQMFCRGGGLGVWGLVKTYFKDIWNWIDFASIVIFIIGISLRCISQKHWNTQSPSLDDVTENITVTFEWAHVFLSLDFVLFLARLLQIFCMHQKLGPMITMVFKMMKELGTFMVILILACLAYAVTSHAILYPNGQTQFTLAGLYKIPAQAFWSIFGDLAIVETLKAKPVENGEEKCSFNRSVVAQGELPACPSSLSRYLVPIMLGFYLLVANVLLLNLLIALFGNTYSEVKERAKVHWRWQRCVVINEFKSRPLLPPPFNVLALPFPPLGWSPGCRRASCRTSCFCWKIRNEETGTQTLPNDPGKIKMKTIEENFIWEKKMSDKFIRIRKNREENANEINGLTSGQNSMKSAMKTLDQDLRVVRRLVENLVQSRKP